MLKLVVDNTKNKHRVGDMVAVHWPDLPDGLVGVIVSRVPDGWGGRLYSIVISPNETLYCTDDDIVRNVTAELRNT